MKDFYRRYPVLFPLFGFVTGIFLASKVEVFSRAPFFNAILLLALGLLFYFFRKNSALHLGFIFLIFTLLGGLRLGDHFFKEPPARLQVWVRQKSKVEISFRVESYCQVKNDSNQVFARLLSGLDNGRGLPKTLPIKVKFRAKSCDLLPGQIYRAVARFNFPDRFQNPSSFDYPHYLRAQGAFAVAWISDPQQMQLIQNDAPPLLRGIMKGRDWILKTLQTEITDPQVLGVLQSLILGEKKNLDPKLEEAFRRSGLTHLLVVSGLHLGLFFLCFSIPIYFLFFLKTSWADRGIARKLALGMALIPTAGYAAMVGMSPSVLRASLWVVLAVIALLQDWRKDFVSLLMLTVLLLLGLDPRLLWSLSFQFSFISVVSIFFFGKSFQKYLDSYEENFVRFRWKALRWVLLTLYTSATVNLALYPILAESFHEASWIAPISNLIFIPLYSLLLLPGALLALALRFVSLGLSHFIFGILQTMAQASLGLLRFFSELPFASSLVSPLSAAEWFAFIFLCLGLLLLYRPRRLAFCLWLSFSFWAFQRCDDFFRALKPVLKVSMLDVGQGDSMLFELPNGQSLLVDGGGIPYSDFDLGQNVLMPELLGRGLASVTVLVMTHADADHIKGFQYLVERMPPQEFWLSSTSWNAPGFAALKKLLLAKKIPLRFLKQGEVIQKGSVNFEVLWPPKSSALLSDNNRSLVLRVCYQHVCILSTGDIEQEAEDALIASGFDLRSMLLKVPHHGSNTSSSSHFLQAVRPRFALVSTGRHNRFNFPRPQVLARLELLGSSVLRTDLAGQIQIVTDGKKVFYETYSGLKGEIKDNF